LILGRNELAKWQQLNSKKIELSRRGFIESGFDQDGGSQGDSQHKWDMIEVVKLPPMIARVSECKLCFSKEICSLAAISLEADIVRKAPISQFATFAEI
jgi:hypothetical protein